ncbi:hypothetical protein A2U01_0103277, partial [Trifolium medium]|nr:hypothetical protein [Trifolium medium]
MGEKRHAGNHLYWRTRGAPTFLTGSEATPTG